MKETADAIARLFSHLGTLLRYVAPGFAALFVVAAVVPKARPFLSSGSSAVVVLGMILGPTIYALCRGTFVLLVWRPIVALLKKKDPTSISEAMSNLDGQRRLGRDGSEGQIKPIGEKMGSLSTSVVMSTLDEQRWHRQASSEDKVKLMQGKMDEWAAMQNLLYSLSYIMILIPAVAKIARPCAVISSWWMLSLGGLFILMSALYSEYRLTAVSVRLTKEYPDGEKSSEDPAQET